MQTKLTSPLIVLAAILGDPISAPPLTPTFSHFDTINEALEAEIGEPIKHENIVPIISDHYGIN